MTVLERLMAHDIVPEQDVVTRPRVRPQPCGERGCSERHYAAGLCLLHYRQQVYSPGRARRLLALTPALLTLLEDDAGGDIERLAVVLAGRALDVLDDYARHRIGPGARKVEA